MIHWPFGVLNALLADVENEAFEHEAEDADEVFKVREAAAAEDPRRSNSCPPISIFASEALSKGFKIHNFFSFRGGNFYFFREFGTRSKRREKSSLRIQECKEE